MRKQRPAILLEVLIATALAIVVLAFLFNAFYLSSRVLIETQHAEESFFGENYLEQRLSHAFFKILPVDNQNDFFYFSKSNESPALVFSYDNGENLNHNFSGDVISRLYLNLQKELILLTWPSRDSWAEEKLPTPFREILLDQVEELKWEFFNIPENGSIKASWVEEWPKEWGSIPGLIRLKLLRNNKSQVYMFITPTATLVDL